MSKIPSSVKQFKISSTSCWANPALRRSSVARFLVSAAFMMLLPAGGANDRRARPSTLVGQDQRSRGRKHAAHAVHERDRASGNLALTALPAKLTRRLDDREDPVHPGVRVREAAAIGVDRQ